MAVYDIIIVGSGPAGLAAAIYAKRACLNTLVLEKNFMSGGQVLNTYDVDNYPGLPGIGGFDLGMKLREHADGLGAEFVTVEVQKVRKEEDIYIVETDQGEFETKTVIIATGAHHRKLNIPGEDTLAGRGVSYCATCDGAFFRNKVTAVVGGGDVAVEDAIFLARICEKVYVIHRRDELRAAKSLQEKLFSLPNVEMVWNSVVHRIEGENSVSSIIIEDIHKKEEKMLAVDGIFIAVGIEPNSTEFKGLVEMDGGGYIVAGEEGHTSEPGIFAAGDVRTKALRQIVTAAADGANAVFSAEKYLIEKR